MTTIAIRAKGASKPSQAKDPKPQYDDAFVDLTAKQIKSLNGWSEARQLRLDAEKLEKAYKAELDAILPEVPVGQRIKIRAKGIVRVVVGWRPREGTDRDLLLQGFPEAYEATKTHIDYQVYNPA
jgi:hypothetical protein